MNGSDSDVNNKLKVAKRMVEETLAKAEAQAKAYGAQAARERRWHNFAKAAMMALAIITPVFVTYQVQENGPHFLRFVAMGITALTGIVTGLYSTFRWGDNFGRSRLAQLALEELVGTTRFRIYEIDEGTDLIKAYMELSKLNDNAFSELRRIIRQHVESEVAVVKDEQKAIVDRH